MIFLAVERAHVYASHIRWTGHPEQKVTPVGQKLRETMSGVLSPLLRHLLRPPAYRRNPIQRPVAGGRKQNRAFAIPRSATRRRGVGQGLHRPIFHVDSFQCLMSEESDRLAVGGPEGRETRLRSRQRLRNFGIERTEPDQKAIAAGRRGREHDGTSVWR